MNHPNSSSALGTKDVLVKCLNTTFRADADWDVLQTRAAIQDSFRGVLDENFPSEARYCFIQDESGNYLSGQTKISSITGKLTFVIGTARLRGG
jgi:hypothetical protein